MPAFHPDLYPAARFLPRSVRPALIVRLLQLREALRRSQKSPRLPRVDGVIVRDVFVPSLHPFPVPLEDCYAALRWLSASADALGVRPERIAIGGSSAGAGLAAGLV